MKTLISLSFYSYDNISNPWLGGGGAYRDVEILRRYLSYFPQINLIVGNFPGRRQKNIGDIHIHYLGFGSSEISSRITYVLMANLKMLFQKKGVIGFNISPYSPFFSWMFKKNKHFGIVHHVIGENWKTKLGRIGHLAMNFESWLVKNVKNLVVINPAVADWARSRHHEKNIFVSANGFDPVLLNIPDQTNFDNPYLLFIGRLDVYMKGLDILLEAFVKVKVKFPNLRLVLAGKAVPSSVEKIRELCRKNNLLTYVQIKTNIKEDEKQQLLGQCMFFVSPSRFEGWGIAALEANAAGKAVIASDAEGFKMSLKNGYSAVLVKAEDTFELSGQIIKLLENPVRLKEMNEKGRLWARNFSWEEIASRELDWVKKILAG